MLRVLLKRFIILCTRVAENRQGVRKENGMQFETIRKFYVLVDTHFKEKKQVQEYADMLDESPEDIRQLPFYVSAAICYSCYPQSCQAEAERLLLYTAEKFERDRLVAGFEDQATFSRFFKNATGLSATEYRHQYKKGQ